MNKEPPVAAPQVKFPPALYPLLGIGAGFFLQRIIPLPISKHTTFEVAGWFCFGLSLLLIISSLLTMRKNKTTAMPHLAAQQLVMTGPFRFSRNPIYVAFLLLVLASALATGNIWTLLTLPVIMLFLKKRAIDPEEAYLQERFGAQYASYTQKVRRWW